MSKSRVFSIWSVLAIGLVVGGAALTKSVSATGAPIYESGAGVPAAYDAGNWKQTANLMVQTYQSYKKVGFDQYKLPLGAWQYPDQQYSEEANGRLKQVTGYVIPTDPTYSEVAFWSQAYFRQNIKVYKDHTTANPKGYFLVMYKDGVLEKVDAKDVRMIPHPTIPDGMIPVFPHMRQYDPDLPLLPAFQDAG